MACGGGGRFKGAYLLAIILGKPFRSGVLEFLEELEVLVMV